MCAFLAPEPIPEQVFTRAAAELPAVLADRRRIRWPGGRSWPGSAGRRWPAIDQRGLLMHRLTQAILRDRLPPDQAAATRACAEAVLAASDPGDPDDPGTWPEWARLLPHLLALTSPPPTIPACASWPATRPGT